MDPIDICKYIGRDIGIITKDDASGVHGRFGKCHFTVTDKVWTIRNVRRQSSGTSPIMFITMLHKKNGIVMDALTAALLIDEIKGFFEKKTA